MTMDVSVIMSTYNHPRWLEKVIWGFAVQTHRQFELVIADDGSNDVTRDTIERLRAETDFVIKHVWHEDQGFRKCEILNKAILASAYQYLVFTDGDCVPRRDFLAQHVRFAEQSRFLSGGMFRLPKRISIELTREQIRAGHVMDPHWLRHQGLRHWRTFRLSGSLWAARLLDGVTTTRATFNGHNSSAWKHDVMLVNGFDEDMTYGGLDRELGERLVNVGVVGKQIRHRAVCIHLHHKRDYASKQGWTKNHEIRRMTIRTRRTWAPHGISQHARLGPMAMIPPSLDVLKTAS